MAAPRSFSAKEKACRSRLPPCIKLIQPRMRRALSPVRREQTLYQRLLLAILVGFLAFEPTFGQDSGQDYQSIPTDGRHSAGSGDQKSLRLKGVLISESSRTALISGRPVQRGDRIGGAEILRIEQQGIRVRIGAEELTVSVGGTFAGNSSAPAFVRATTPARLARPDGRRALHERTQLTAARVSSELDPGSELRHTVKSGETLSGIASRHLRDGLTVEQMMMALFQSNPQAFSNNINQLYAGATLSIPSGLEAASQEPAVAAAAVARHLDAWQNDARFEATVAAATPAQEYGPVESGETLSDIAADALQDGVTLDQMMIALYEANPQAFSNNINILYEGAVLRMPSNIELRRQAPEVATGEVVRQTNTWQTGVRQHAMSAPLQPSIMAAADIPVD